MTDRAANYGRVQKWIGHSSWSFVGVALAILFGLTGLYTGLFYHRKSELVFHETANTAVFNVNEPVESLEIRYRGVDLRQAKKALTIVQFTVRNEGTEPILKPYFDERDLPGVSVYNDLADIKGLSLAEPEIIRAEVTGASSQYLRSNVHLTSVGHSVRFAPIILDAGKSFRIRLLLSHSVYTFPVLRPVGMVAGVDAIRYDDTEVAGATGFRGMLVAAFGEDDPWIQVFRLAVSGLGVIVLTLLVSLVVKQVDRWRARRAARKRFAIFETRHPELVDELRPFAEELLREPWLAETLVSWLYLLANNPASWQDAPKSEDTWVAILWRVLSVEDGLPSQARIAALGSALLAYFEAPVPTERVKEKTRRLDSVLQRLASAEGAKKLPEIPLAEPVVPIV